MARCKYENKLINREDIIEELKLINGSDTDYITPSGKIYKDYGNNKFFPKKNVINKYNGYIYCSITFSDGKNRQRRVHNLLAKAYIPNPNNYPIVMHLDNNKLNISLDNLKWGTVQENTQQAFDDGLAKNDKGYDDSQSYPVDMYDLYTRKLIQSFGSCSIAEEETHISKSTILRQAKDLAPVRHDIYFRFQKDGNINPPPYVVQYDYYTDEIIGYYYNTWDASRRTKISDRTISCQCVNNCKPKTLTKSRTYFLRSS